VSVTTQPSTTTNTAVRDVIMGRVEGRLRRFLAAERSRWTVADGWACAGIDAIDHLIAAGGKRIRPAFCVTGYLAGGGDPADPAIVDAAAALELLHACALLHDDIMDDSALRRGLPTAHTRYTAEHAELGWQGESRRFGEAVAILAGDLALVYSEQLMPTTDRAARDIWDGMRSELIVGQLVDVVAAARFVPDPQLARWVAIRKSGRYSVERPLVLGATLAGAPDLVEAFEVYGLAVGEAFQLRDDLIDVSGDAAVTGKPTGLDLADFKMTLLLATAMEHDPTLRAAVLDGPPDDGGQRVRRLLVDTGALDDIEGRIDDLVDRAGVAITAAPLDPAWRAALTDLASQVCYREK
jgi:geranylgeranyl diphosphate synthase type I